MSFLDFANPNYLYGPLWPPMAHTGPLMEVSGGLFGWLLVGCRRLLVGFGRFWSILPKTVHQRCIKWHDRYRQWHFTALYGPLTALRVY